MKTIVYTLPPHPEGPRIFEGCVYKIDDNETLHIFAPRGDGRNNVMAAYAKGSYGHVHTSAAQQ